ncbi:helix-turn-helix domain-containing protein [Kovacikia minuta CCNUW1]|uniref:helix-turn-helix domain-containing protein n=1 Tax=Kovacikia minuta TaxID=2931930 RepID=UPI001CCF1AED|nr:helix-turn-helix domain-containing protein [Kovacikia minuta CCNUW1]
MTSPKKNRFYRFCHVHPCDRALLRTTSLSVAAIATKVGFSNQNQLTTQFRKFTGTTPSRYRKIL